MGFGDTEYPRSSSPLQALRVVVRTRFSHPLAINLAIGGLDGLKRFRVGLLQASNSTGQLCLANLDFFQQPLVQILRVSNLASKKFKDGFMGL